MKNKQDWLEIKIYLNPENLEWLSPYLFALGSEGIFERENDFFVYFKTGEWNQEKFYLLKQYLAESSPEHGETNIETLDLPDEDWNEAWKESFKTFHLGENIVVKPDWDSYSPNPGETVITIAPKMAFGTGHHETTQLILMMLEKYLRADQSLLDAGTGSGILAIYGAMLGANPVVAFDNDHVATENTLENAGLNGVSEKITCFTGELIDAGKDRFDMIVANINRNVLLDLASGFFGFLKPGGKLILSGLLIVDEDVIMDAYRKNGWTMIHKEQRKEWMALVLDRK
ncbi:MAG: 50S ribosomal protein L11 methyltransferase [Calditrichaceae bacterium]